MQSNGLWIDLGLVDLASLHDVAGLVQPKLRRHGSQVPLGRTVDLDKQPLIAAQTP